MKDNLPRIIDAFEKLHVVVIGEAKLDSYLLGSSGRLCPEAPVPVVTLRERRDAPGGAANTAVNVRSLGAQVSFLSIIGDDCEGTALRAALQDHGVSADSLRIQPSRRTLAKQRIIASSQILVRFDQGDTTPIGPQGEDDLIRQLTAVFPRCDAVIISDYSYGILTPRVISALADLQARLPRIIVADSKRLAAYRRVGLTAVKPNHAEALQLLGVQAMQDPRGRIDGMLTRGKQLLQRTGSRIAAVTLDTEGALTFERKRPPYRTYGRPNPQARAAGAGDTFISAFSLALAAGSGTPAAAELAAAAAAVVVTKEGTASCSAPELQGYFVAGNKAAADLCELAARLEKQRRQGRRIVFTNGCFDILHRGHVTYLSRAKALGDVLVVGVNSDEGIHRLKGPSRPINSLEDRLQVLAALSCVDHLVAFDEDTPHNLIRVLRPAVFVKGGDYTRDRLPEASLVEELGGTVHILPYVDDRSTTGLIRRIRETEGWGDGQVDGHRPAFIGNRTGVGVHSRNGHTRGQCTP
jgi:D-beta-D-heptose 7-phosphate kinase/D-beta-D-heptose 1-phosphate adenosyltransferase